MLRCGGAFVCKCFGSTLVVTTADSRLRQRAGNELAGFLPQPHCQEIRAVRQCNVM